MSTASFRLSVPCATSSFESDLGEITRNILLHFIDSSLLFGGHSSEILNTHYGYDTAFVSKVAGAKSDEEIKKIIVADLQMDVDLITPSCIEIVRWAVRMVAGRASALAACAIAAVIVHTGNDKPPSKQSSEEDTGVDVGLDGSVAEFLPGFEEGVRKALKVLLGEEGAKRVRMGLAKDGSGVGGEWQYHFMTLPTCSWRGIIYHKWKYRLTRQPLSPLCRRRRRPTSDWGQRPSPVQRKRLDRRGVKRWTSSRILPWPEMMNW